MAINYKDKIIYRKSSELSDSKYRATVLYADTGKRKTTTALHMILNKGLYVAADNSWQVLLDPMHKDLLEKIDGGFVEYDSLSQLKYLEPEGRDTIVLDTVTRMADKYLNLVTEKGTWSRGTGYREVISTTDPELKGAASAASVDYLLLRDKFRPIIEQLILDYPCHIIFLMHAQFPTDMSKGAVNGSYIRPRLSPATWQIIAELANIVGYISGGKAKSGFEVNVDEASTVYLGKSQVAGIKKHLDLDDFVRIYKETLQ